MVHPVQCFVKTDRRGLGGETARSLEVVGAPPTKPPVADPALQAAAARSEAETVAVQAARKRQREDSVVAALRADFRDADDAATADVNPLLRGKGKMSASNPLRGLL